jgi:hypothetical protein
MKVFKTSYTVITWLIISALVAVNIGDGKFFEILAIMGNAIAIIAILLSLRHGKR